MTSLIHPEEAFTRFIEVYRDENDNVRYEQAISELSRSPDGNLMCITGPT